MENVTIRNATIDDLHEIQNLSHELFISDFQFDTQLNMQWSYEEDGQNFIRECIMNKDKNMCLVAENHDHIVGYLSGEILKEQLWRPIPRAQLSNIYIEKDYRHQGVGKKLVEEFLIWAKEKGVKKTCIVAYAENSNALEFYKNLGLVPKLVTLEADIM